MAPIIEPVPIVMKEARMVVPPINGRLWEGWDQRVTTLTNLSADGVVKTVRVGAGCAETVIT
jgi:hypothetical protein